MKFILIALSSVLFFGCATLPTGESIANVNPNKNVLVVGSIIFYDGDRAKKKFLTFNGFNMVIKDKSNFGHSFDYPSVKGIENSTNIAFTVSPGKYSLDRIYYKEGFGEPRRLNVPLNISFNAKQGEIVNLGLIVVVERFSSFDFDILENQKHIKKYVKRHLYINDKFKQQEVVLNDDPRMVYDSDEDHYEEDEYEGDDDEEQVNWEESV